VSLSKPNFKVTLQLTVQNKNCAAQFSAVQLVEWSSKEMCLTAGAV